MSETTFLKTREKQSFNSPETQRPPWQLKGPMSTPSTTADVDPKKEQMIAYRRTFGIITFIFQLVRPSIRSNADRS
jgi:hypothetical protein